MNRKGIVANVGYPKHDGGTPAYILISLMIAFVYLLIFVFTTQVL